MAVIKPKDYQAIKRLLSRVRPDVDQNLVETLQHYAEVWEKAKASVPSGHTLVRVEIDDNGNSNAVFVKCKPVPHSRKMAKPQPTKSQKLKAAAKTKNGKKKSVPNRGQSPRANSDEITAVRERRIRQFEHYLGIMEHRTLRLAKSDCFLVFSVRMPREIRMRLGSKTRIVQFAFMKTGFYVDLPDTTLTPDEAKIILATRPGFEFALNRAKKRLGERQYDPVQKQYQYNEQRSAAEDTAYIFFDLWETSLDACIKVEAAAFETKRQWERNFSMG